MKLAIMQPYFLPYIGYFQLINNCDEFILFDTPQFIRHGWIERNRILNTNGEPLFIKVPLEKHKRETTINNVAIRNTENWKQKILAQLTTYKKKAPYYWDVLKLLNKIFELETNSIVELNFLSIKLICNFLKIKTPIKIWSKMNVDIDTVNAPDEWALNICKALNAKEYINPINGMSFFNKMKYDEKGVELLFLESKPITYNQISNEFVPFLSIIDVMMFCDKEEINKMINNFDLK